MNSMGIQLLFYKCHQDWRKINTFIAILAKPVTALIVISRSMAKIRGLRRAHIMSRLSAVLIVCAALSATTGLAHAGACADQITQLRQAAQLDHQPESVGQGQTYAQLIVAAELAQAGAQDALGHEPACLLAARRAKQVLELP